MDKSRTRIKGYISLCCAVAALYFFFTIAGIGCPIKFITGIPCLGCGMTRAVISVLRFNFSAALYFHPMVVVVIPTVVFYMLDYFLLHLKNFPWKIVIDVICLLFVICFLVRISFGYGIFSEWDIKDGMFYRISSFVYNLICKK